MSTVEKFELSFRVNSLKLLLKLLTLFSSGEDSLIGPYVGFFKPLKISCWGKRNQLNFSLNAFKPSCDFLLSVLFCRYLCLENRENGSLGG